MIVISTVSRYNRTLYHHCNLPLRTLFYTADWRRYESTVMIYLMLSCVDRWRQSIEQPVAVCNGYNGLNCRDMTNYNLRILTSDAEALFDAWFSRVMRHWRHWSSDKFVGRYKVSTISFVSECYEAIIVLCAISLQGRIPVRYELLTCFQTHALLRRPT